MRDGKVCPAMAKEDSFNSSEPSTQPRRVQFGPFEVDLHTHELWKDGVRLKLAGQPFQILVMLLSRPGELVSRDDLQKHLWPEDTFSDSNHGLNAAVNKLRETLTDAASDPRYIETLPRRGYRFIGKISYGTPKIHAERRSEAVVSPTTPPPVSIALPMDASTRRAFPIAVALALCLGFIFLGTMKEEKHNAFTAENDSQPMAETKQQKIKDTHLFHAVPEHHPAVPDISLPAVYHEASTTTISPSLRTVIDGNSGNAAPQFSPDGHRIAFMSNRSGPWQIWVSYVDGSHPVQLSFTESAGTPRWSPDGRTIAFDAPSEEEGTSIFITASDGSSRARRLVEGAVPSFSRDRRFIYYASDRTGRSQVWKIPVSGGPEQQVTQHGGFAALESSDGYVYYSKSPGRDPEICRVRVTGGDEDCTLQHLRPRTWSSWAVTRNGILFAEDLPNGRSTLSVYEPAKHQVRGLVYLPSAPVWMGARPDGQQAILNDSAERTISLVENLR
jgi:DNA-binding winged helix-turn-helix (wHTH) protein